MAEKTHSDQDAKDQLWQQLEDGRLCMLWIPSTDQHPQPMTLYADSKARAIWFITSSDTDLATAVGSGVEAWLTFASKDQDFQASLAGHMEFSQDRDKLDEIWTVAAGAWFEQGRDDPKVRLLKLSPKSASVWASDSNAILVGLKLLRAGISDGQSDPDIGVHHILNLDLAA